MSAPCIPLPSCCCIAIAAGCWLLPAAGHSIGHSWRNTLPHLSLTLHPNPWLVPGPARRFLDDPDSAAFDLVVVYYGTNSSFACPQCLHVFRFQGPK